MQQEAEKLMNVIIEYVDDFVTILVKATVMFYQLDLKSGETTMVCLKNLLTSLTLKNPVYSKVIDVFRSAFKGHLRNLES